MDSQGCLSGFAIAALPVNTGNVIIAQLIFGSTPRGAAVGPHRGRLILLTADAAGPGDIAVRHCFCGNGLALGGC